MKMVPNPADGRIRVAHIITRLELGGAQLNTLYTCAHLSADRFELHLLAGAGGLLDSEAGRDGRFRLHLIPGLVRRIDPVRDLIAFVRIFRLLKRIRPAIVHTHSSKAGILGRWAARLAGIRVRIHTYHGFGFHDGQPWWLRRLLIWLERWTIRTTTHFLAVSRRTLRIGEEERVLDPERAECLPSGVEIDRLARIPRQRLRLIEEIQAEENCLLVGMVACLKPQKAPVDFVRMAARVLLEVPEARFLLVGDGILRAEVAGRICREGLQGRVYLLGWRREIPELIAGLDLLVLTSLWEGLPRVFAEARAMGVPIAATRVGGAEEAVVDGRSGILVEPGDVEGMARRVIHVLRDRDLRRRMAERAKEGLERFDIRSMVRRQEELYRELLEDRSLKDSPALARAG